MQPRVSASKIKQGIAALVYEKRPSAVIYKLRSHLDLMVCNNHDMLEIIFDPCYINQSNIL